MITCNYKVVEDGKTNPTKKDDVNRLKNRGDFSVFCWLIPAADVVEYTINEATLLLTYCDNVFSEMSKEVNKKRIASFG